jgi:hypothetical protein
MRKTMVLVCLVCIHAGCLSKTPGKFEGTEKILMGNNIDLKNVKKNLIIFYNDNSCDICYKNLEYYINKLQSKDFLLLYFSRSTKIKYEQTVLKNFIRKEQFRLVNDESLFNDLSKITNDYKGIYEIKIDDEEIISIKPLTNY